MDILDESRKRLNKKTPGPWGFDRWGNNNIIALDSNQEICSLANNDNDHDGGFIAWATEDINYLLAEVERLKKENEEATLTYKDYTTIIRYSAEDKCLWGKLEDIGPLVDFYSNTAYGVKRRFHEAVDDYISLLKELEKEAEHDNLHGQH